MKSSIKSEDRRLKLDVKHGFGSLGYTNIKEGIAFLEDDAIKVGFPIGKCFAIKGIDKNEMNFLKIEDEFENLMNVTISKNRKLVAFSEKIYGESMPVVSIYNIQGNQQKEKKSLLFKYPDAKGNNFISMAFAYDDPRYLALLTGTTEAHIIMLDTLRMRPLATLVITQGGTRISISPRDNHILFVSGDRIARLIKVNEGSIKPLKDIQKLNTNQKFYDHCWTEDQKLLCRFPFRDLPYAVQCIVTNDTGQIYVIALIENQYEVVQEISNCYRYPGIDPNLAAMTIKSFSKGFIAGADNGTIAIWMRTDDSEQADNDGKYYNFLRIRNPDHGRRSAICSIDVSYHEDYAAFCFTNNDLAIVAINQLAPSVTDVNDPIKVKKILDKEVPFDYLYNGFHNGPITSLDICLQRPFVATCSRFDSSIRIWNYINPKCEIGIKLHAKTDEANPLLSIAFHPSGYYLAVGFVDKLRIYHVLSENLRKYKEIPSKYCTMMKFSNGGHLLAVACQKQKASNYIITIYNAYSLESAANIKTNSLTLSDILWTPNDDYFYTCGHNGAVYEWETKDFTTRKDMISDNAKFFSLTTCPNGMIYVCGVEQGKNVVKEIIKGTDFGQTFTLNNYKLTAMCSITSLFKLGGIIGGTDLGHIKIFPESFNNTVIDTFPVHNTEITKLICSPDGKYVFSISDDNALFIYQVSEINENGSIARISNIRDEDAKDLNPKADIVDKDLADLILISRADIEQHKSMIKTLRIQIDDLSDKMEAKATEDRLKLEKEQAASKEQMRKSINEYERQYEELKSQKIQLEKDYANLLKQMKNSHMKAVEELEMLYEKKLAFENEKYLQLEQALIEEKNKNIEKLRLIEKKHEETIEKLQAEYKDNFTKSHKIFENTKQIGDNIKREYEEKLNQQEQEHEDEIKELHAMYQKKIDELKFETVEYKNKNDTFQVDNRKYLDKLSSMMNEAIDKTNQIKDLEKKLVEANNHIEILKKEIEERDDNIAKKEKKIYEYKYKISDLQKSKHVLSFRTTEMRKSLEPKEAQIENLKEELFKLESEFENVLKASHTQNDKLIKTEKKIELLNANIKKQTELLNQKENLIHSIIMDIHNCIKSKEPKDWANEMKRLYQVYVINTEVKQESTDPRGIEEMIRQKEHLEKSISQINKTTENLVKRRNKDIFRKTLENSDLICDLNELRQRNKELEHEISNIKKENDALKKDKKSLQEEISRMNLQGFRRRDGLNKESESQLDSKVSINQLVQLTNNYIDKKDTGGSGSGSNVNSVYAMPPLYQVKPERDINLTTKGKIAKGSMFDMRAQALNDKIKLSELQAENEMYMHKMIQQENEIRNLKGKLIKAGLLEEEDEKSIQEIKLNHITENSRASSAQQERKNISPRYMSPKFGRDRIMKNASQLRSSSQSVNVSLLNKTVDGT